MNEDPCYNKNQCKIKEEPLITIVTKSGSFFTLTQSDYEKLHKSSEHKKSNKNNSFNKK